MKTGMKIRTYSELVGFLTFEERFEYLKLDGRVGKDTFGFDRYLNQLFYHSRKWLKLRDEIIIRDNGCDLGVEGYEIFKGPLIHHINPITIEDIERESDFLLNPEFLITTTQRTHNALHYGINNPIQRLPQERTPNDTCPWKR